MKSRLTLAIVGCTLLTLLNPYILTAQARNIGTNGNAGIWDGTA